MLFLIVVYCRCCCCSREGGGDGSIVQGFGAIAFLLELDIYDVGLDIQFFTSLDDSYV